ncbi:MAG: hypothetical protein WC073_11195 [Sterolibacterium sp.]
MPKKCRNFIVAIVATLLAGSAIAENNHENHRHQFSKDVDALHEVLAPLWHAHAGNERSQKVCAQAQKLESLTRDIQSGDTKNLLGTIAALKAQCQASPTDIDAVFSQVHEAFHRLAEPKAY